MDIKAKAIKSAGKLVEFTYGSELIKMIMLHTANDVIYGFVANTVRPKMFHLTKVSNFIIL